jgi:hypothetical protein
MGWVGHTEYGMDSDDREGKGRSVDDGIWDTKKRVVYSDHGSGGVGVVDGLWVSNGSRVGEGEGEVGNISNRK